MIVAKGFLKLTYATKTKESITCQKLGPKDFSSIASVHNKGKFAIPLLFNSLEVLSDKAKLFSKNSSKNSNLDDSGTSVFPARTNLKLHNISVTPKMVKKVITNLELLKASGPDCVAAVALKNFESELLYIPAQLINKCLKESCF